VDELDCDDIGGNEDRDEQGNNDDESAGKSHDLVQRSPVLDGD
jgi:hypothetical protein